MILVDANLLIYAKMTSFLQHEAARNWLDDRLNGAAPVGVAWISLVAPATPRRTVKKPRPSRIASLATWRRALLKMRPSPDSPITRLLATPPAPRGALWAGDLGQRSAKAHDHPRQLPPSLVPQPARVKQNICS